MMNLRVSKLKLFQPSFFSQKSQTISRVAKKAWKEFWLERNGQMLKTWVTLKLRISHLKQTQRSLEGAFGVRMGIYESVPWLGEMVMCGC